MSPDDEVPIERYVRHPGSMGAEERRAVERLIEQDPGASAYAEFLRGFYERLDEESGQAPNARVDAFVDNLFESSETVIPVQPFQPPRDARPTVLAADTETPGGESRFSVLTTLAAEAEEMLVRIVGDRDTNQGRLYVLANPPARRAHVVVSFPDLGIDLVADAEGRRAFDLPSEIGVAQWAEARALVRRPVATEEVEPSSTATVDLPSGGMFQCRRQAGTLTASIEAEGAVGPSLLTVGGPDRSPRLLHLQYSSPAECTVSGEGELRLRLYE